MAFRCRCKTCSISWVIGVAWLAIWAIIAHWACMLIALFRLDEAIGMRALDARQTLGFLLHGVGAVPGTTRARL